MLPHALRTECTRTTAVATLLLVVLILSNVCLGQKMDCSNVTAMDVMKFSQYSCAAISHSCFQTMPQTSFRGFTSQCVASFNGNAIQGILKDQVKHMPGESFRGWSSNIEYMGPACSGWTSEQTGNLTDEHACEALGIDCFSAMRADAYAGFSFQCVANWRDNELGGGITAKDISRIPVESIGGLNDHDVLGWGRECAGFRADQLREMSGLACASLSPDCLESISPRACKEGFSRSRHSPCQSLTAKCGAASTDGPAALASTRRSTLVMTGGEKALKESKTSDSPTSRSDAETATGPTLPDNPYYYNYYYSYRKQSRGPNNGLLDKDRKRGKHTSGLTAFSVAGVAAVASMSLIFLASSIAFIWEKVRKSYLLTEYAEFEVVSDNGKIGDVMMRMYKRRWGCA